MSRLPMSLVTCPGPGGPVTFSPPTYVIRHVHGGQLWTAAQHNIPVVFVVVRNGEYAALKEFTRFMHAPDAPGMELPDMDIPGDRRARNPVGPDRNSNARPPVHRHRDGEVTG
jgi:hypothetical protein